MSLQFPEGRDLRGVAYDVYFGLAHLSRSQIYRSVANLLRYEVNEAFASSRTGAEAAFRALMMAHGELTEDDYLSDDQSVTRLWRKARNFRLKRHRLADEVEPFLKIFDLSSQHGSHASASVAGRLLRYQHEKLFTSFFDDLSDDALIDRFLGMLWVGGLCAKTYISIGELGDADMTSGRAFYARWRSDAEPKMRSRGLLDS